MQASVILSYSKALFSAYADWLEHLNASAEKKMAVSNKILETASDFWHYYSTVCHDPLCPKCINVNPTDHRFKNNLWSDLFPFNLYSQLFLSNEHILNNISSNVPGVKPHHEHLVNFTLRQAMDVFSPSNFPWTNPLIIKAAYEQVGMNFIKGYLNFAEDLVRKINHEPPVGVEGFEVGHNLAVTPGQVIYRNRLIELIQYIPTTTQVHPQPILIIPAWIMKYYILDLSPYNSLVKYLVDSGHTVFMISWKNPDSKDRNLTLEDYMSLGVLDSLKVINNVIPEQQIHCAGYCIGGTLLMLSAAYMAATRDKRIKSITLFAAQVDFVEAGELRLFIDEDQIKALEAIMNKTGYLSGEQMAASFNMLHAQDLIWSRYVQDYMLGIRYPLSDMMAWNADTTRLPYKMHSEYLRKLYLHNNLANGDYKIKGKILNLQQIKQSMFVVSTIKDHVAPWKSVYKIHQLTNTDINYILTRGGHNSGIVSEPGHKDRSYQLLLHKTGHKVLTPEKWQEKAPQYEGSWWLAWEKWLAHFSDNMVTPPAIMGSKKYKALCAAPGTYILQR